MDDVLLVPETNEKEGERKRKRRRRRRKNIDVDVFSFPVFPFFPSSSLYFLLLCVPSVTHTSQIPDHSILYLSVKEATNELEFAPT